jgi:pimeloyl-ACP methyl ester carboxylesterase
VAEAKSPAPAASQAAAPAAASVPRFVPLATGTRPRASTAARAEARRKGVDLASLQGSGRNGRVSRSDVAAALRPARATYHVDTPHGRIFFREWPAQGQQKGSVLLLHGLFADSQSFTTLGRKLASKGYRCYALDLPGHGETVSSAENLDAIVQAVSAALPGVKLHIIGHSFGALVASRLIDRALSLTLLAPAGCGEVINGAFLSAMLGGHIEQAITFLGESVPAESQAALASHLSVHAGQLRAITADVAVEGSQKVSILAALASAKVPVQAVFMRDDAVIPAQHVLNLPFNVASRVLPGQGHLPHWRSPDAIVDLVGGG